MNAMDVRIVKIPEQEGGGYCAFVVGHQEHRLRGDGESPVEALRDLANIMEDYAETR